MTVTTSGTSLAFDMIVMGLGLGVAMSSFTVIVQNQYPTQRLGEVSAGLQFFRSIGGTIGMAVFGTILNNRFAAAMLHNLPAPLQQFNKGKGAGLLDNPQVLLSEAARTKIQAAFDQFGPQGKTLFTAFMQAVRQSLATAVVDLFLLATSRRRRRPRRRAVPARGPAAPHPHDAGGSRAAGRGSGGRRDRRADAAGLWRRRRPGAFHHRQAAGAGRGGLRTGRAGRSRAPRPAPFYCRAVRRAGLLLSRQAKPASRASSMGSPSL